MSARYTFRSLSSFYVKNRSCKCVWDTARGSCYRHQFHSSHALADAAKKDDTTACARQSRRLPPPLSPSPTPPPTFVGSKVMPLLYKLNPKWPAYGSLARIDKPIGSWLLLWPCWWSTALAAPLGDLPDPVLLTKFLIGAFVMRGAGCTINDLWDMKYDKLVERTKGRPLASGELRVQEALIFLGGQLTVGLCVLLSLNMEAIKVGFLSMPIVISYPLMKRFTWWPQAVLGLAMNWGALVGWTAVHGSTSWPHVLPLYASGICWTMVYDTLYGHQDKVDDAQLGLKSTSLLFASRTKPILSSFSVCCIGFLGLAGYKAGLTTPFYAGLTVAAAHQAHQIYIADLDHPEQLFDIFRSNQYMGAIVMGSIVAGHF